MANQQCHWKAQEKAKDQRGEWDAKELCKGDASTRSGMLDALWVISRGCLRAIIKCDGALQDTKHAESVLRCILGHVCRTISSSELHYIRQSYSPMDLWSTTALTPRTGESNAQGKAWNGRVKCASAAARLIHELFHCEGEDGVVLVEEHGEDTLSPRRAVPCDSRTSPPMISIDDGSHGAPQRFCAFSFFTRSIRPNWLLHDDDDDDNDDDDHGGDDVSFIAMVALRALVWTRPCREAESTARAIDSMGCSTRPRETAFIQHLWERVVRGKDASVSLERKTRVRMNALVAGAMVGCILHGAVGHDQDGEDAVFGALLHACMLDDDQEGAFLQRLAIEDLSVLLCHRWTSLCHGGKERVEASQATLNRGDDVDGSMDPRHTLLAPMAQSSTRSKGVSRALCRAIARMGSRVFAALPGLIGAMDPPRGRWVSEDECSVSSWNVSARLTCIVAHGLRCSQEVWRRHFRSLAQRWLRSTAQALSSHPKEGRLPMLDDAVTSITSLCSPNPRRANSTSKDWWAVPWKSSEDEEKDKEDFWDVSDDAVHQVLLPAVVERGYGAQVAMMVLIRLIRDDPLISASYGLSVLPAVLGCLTSSHEGVRYHGAALFSKLVQLLPLYLGRLNRSANPRLHSPPPRPPSHSGNMELEQTCAEPSTSDGESSWSSMRASFAEQGKEFARGLTDGGNAPSHAQDPSDVHAKLRPYQKDGLRWILFLAKYNLHGILADDMGLGKTLQTICAVHSTWKTCKEAARVGVSGGSTPSPSSPSPSASVPPNVACDGTSQRSLVICPSSLVSHWAAEWRRFCPSMVVEEAKGSPLQRQQRWDSSGADVWVTSYPIACKDAHFLASRRWLWLVLDEGHVIRNPRSKTTMCVKSISARHRLVLTGTPVHNAPSDLWSLFDFLMPGYLGENLVEFSKRYSSSSQSNRAVAGQRHSNKKMMQDVVLHRLHAAILPFVLRRRKEDVLPELPPKIVQDRLCPLSTLQKELYDEFLRSPLGSMLKNIPRGAFHSTSNDSKASPEEHVRSLRCDPAVVAKKRKSKPVRDDDSIQDNASRLHVFDAVRYLCKLCVHPSLVTRMDQTNDEGPNGLVVTAEEEEEATEGMCVEDEKSAKDMQRFELDDAARDGGSMALEDGHETTRSLTCKGLLRDGPKLAALWELLEECGIGGEGAHRHRALVFAQHRDTLDLIEKAVLKPMEARFFRLDGSMAPSKRQSVVDRFNDDDSIQVLLLSTRAGGLGLNLTGADVCVFMEHDWNPMNDLQAMDRAHRIGQTRTVHVYRLITRDSMEEHIMGLQRFKEKLAHVLVDGEEHGPSRNDASRVLDALSGVCSSTIEDAGGSTRGKASMRADSSSATTTGGRGMWWNKAIASCKDLLHSAEKKGFSDEDESSRRMEEKEYAIDSFTKRLNDS